MRRITLEAEFICKKYKPWSHKSGSRIESGECHLCNSTSVVTYEFHCYDLNMPSIHCCLKCTGLQHLLGSVARNAFLLETTFLDCDTGQEIKKVRPKGKIWPKLTDEDKAFIGKAIDINDMVHAKLYGSRSWKIIPSILKQYKEKGNLSPKQMAVVIKYVNSSISGS